MIYLFIKTNNRKLIHRTKLTFSNKALTVNTS